MLPVSRGVRSCGMGHEQILADRCVNRGTIPLQNHHDALDADSNSNRTVGEFNNDIPLFDKALNPNSSAISKHRTDADYG